MDLEAYNLLLELHIYAGELGESIWSRIEFWSGISFGTIALAYLAPNRLTPPITTLIVSLYILFSFSLFSNVQSDLEKITVLVADFTKIAEQYDIEAEIVAQSGVGPPSLADSISILYIPGLLFSTIGFLILTAYKTRKRKNV